MKYPTKTVFITENLGNKNVLIGNFQKFSESFFKSSAESNLNQFSIHFLK